MKKLNSLLKVALAFLFAGVISLNFVVEPAMATGDFSQTCEDIELIDGSILVASCQDISGDYYETGFYLDDVIGNLDGVLSWYDGNFSLTCTDIGLGQSLSSRDYVLNAQCEKIDGTYVQTDIDLDDYIANLDGYLEFEG